MVVGRFEDGTEVSNHSHETGIKKPEKLNNDFNYSEDKIGSKCPFHAHIRLANPRADIGETDIDSFVKTTRIVRRGIPYEDIPRASMDIEPPFGVGLLFMCYQRSIQNQFEFLQSQWINKGEVGKKNFVGQDGIIGQGSNSFQKHIPEQWNKNIPKVKCDFSNPTNNFVTMKGGEYFFTPSISFIKSLGNTNTIAKKINK
jgi:hypothetical protein